ncbi:hypothetical protein CDC45_18240 (plasmid) [Ralstonia pseudosolanacearum]|uniref:Uncharacterized protein n=1 Tax=Ralstonia nicotianae (strain ATCC BAA-1114 / GMI1000) TaxID=267608 RepID=Q8XTH9_RALN1|nr:hypothetical protein CDC45_18240 [Ralstonia pseudosolanacearum]CAD17282.1 hypothetical protein RSp0131 [Ralstonia pseudosolanacearum GMI1000]
MISSIKNMCRRPKTPNFSTQSSTRCGRTLLIYWIVGSEKNSAAHARVSQDSAGNFFVPDDVTRSFARSMMIPIDIV